LKTVLKEDMNDWLRRHGVACDVSTRKANLFAAIAVLKPKDKVFSMEDVLRAHGDAVLRTPPYMCNLNPIELVWSNIKHYVRSNNMTGHMSLKRLEELVREGLDIVRANDWSGFYQCVIFLENECWLEDGVMEDAVDSFVINLGTSDSELSNHDNLKRTLIQT
jgi:hypothetical protein